MPPRKRKFPLPMQTVQLREGEPTRVDAPLNGGQLDILRQAHVDVRPVASSGSAPGVAWEFRPGTHVGVFRCGDLSIVIRPRIPIDRVMFLVGYSLDPGDWAAAPFPLSPGDDILDAVVPAFVRLTQEAIRRGLLQGYRTEEQSAGPLRGRIRMADQVKERFGLPFPLEATYDEFTEDIEENRLLKTAIGLLWKMPVQSPDVRRELGALRPAFSPVSQASYRRGIVPEVRYTRLNKRYRPAVELARLIIGSSLVEFLPGESVGASFLVDMNRVFETFLRVALRQSLRLSESEWPSANSVGRALHLEEEGQVRLNPGLSWWRGRRCLFVGEVRYGRQEQGTGRSGGRQDDIYRMLAYCTAADLPSGLLVYADNEADSAIHQIRNSGKAIEVVSLDLTGTPQDTLAQVEALAVRVRAHRDEAIAVA